MGVIPQAMKLLKHQLYRIDWLDAASDSKWTNEEAVKRDVSRLEKGITNFGMFLFSTQHFYIFTSGAAQPYLKGDVDAESLDIFDYFAVPKKMVVSIKKI